MNAIWLIARRDLRAYFSSPIAYIVFAVFLILIGWMFFNLLSFYVSQQMQFAAMNFGQKPTINDNVLKPLFGNMNVLLLMLTPFVTMRLFSEERRDHTIELLMTAPIRPVFVVLGKFLSALILLSFMVALTLVYAVILSNMAKPDWGVFLTSYLGLFLVSATYVAVGLFWSSTTENQIVSVVLTFGTLLFFWLISWAAHSAGTFWAEVLNHLSIIGHYSNFGQGVIDTTDVVFYLSAVFLGLFFTVISFDSNHWS